ncbi:hypothetical protein BGX27_007172 [Mortierella sp. AM989]|nr:hypothetical protein BGX27_007172 [Mortierella sp. AM989]
MNQSYNLPNEILFHIVDYLNRPQLISCALVCKSWNAALGPQLWSYLELGSNKLLPHLPSEELYKKSSWLRSLVFKDCLSIIRYSILGKLNTQLQSLTIKTKWEEDYIYSFYWVACRELIRRNRRTLKSLALTDLPFPASKSKYKLPTWSPLLNFAHIPQSNLRTLRIENCCLPYRHLSALWDICERLEVLHLVNVPFELPRLHKIRRAVAGTGPRQSKPNLGSKHQDRAVRFPSLLELTLDESGPKNSLTALERIIRPAVKLKKLHWNIHCYSWFPITRFLYLFSGQAKYHRTPAPEYAHLCIPLSLCTAPCWPSLESLTLGGHYFQAFEPEDYILIVEMSIRLQALDIPLHPLAPSTMHSLLRLHSNSLTTVDCRKFWTDGSFDWVQPIFFSCPNLTKVCLGAIHAQELLEGCNSWVCCNSLEEFRIGIDMNPHGFTPPRPDMTEQEKQDLSWDVFTHLARLLSLKILDLHVQDTFPGVQFTTSMGLQLLSNWTELEELRFHGDQNMTPYDVEWMIQHWQSLKTIHGGNLAYNSRFSSRPNPRDYTLAATFKKSGIATPDSKYPCGNMTDFEVNWNDTQNEWIPSESEAEIDPCDGLELDIFQ